MTTPNQSGSAEDLCTRVNRFFKEAQEKGKYVYCNAWSGSGWVRRISCEVDSKDKNVALFNMTVAAPLVPFLRYSTNFTSKLEYSEAGYKLMRVGGTQFYEEPPLFGFRFFGTKIG